MKSKLLIGIGIALLTLAAPSFLRAEQTNNDQAVHYDKVQPCCDRPDFYRAHEFSLDGFGAASLGQYTIEHPSGDRVRQNTEFGAGVGLNYFFSRYIGLGADMYSENTTGVFVDSASASLIRRLPLGHSGFSPYISGGGGYLFELGDVWFAQLGAGIEYRFTPTSAPSWTPVMFCRTKRKISASSGLACALPSNLHRSHVSV